MAGYSGTPLAKKLGIKGGHQVALINAPEGFEGQLVGLPEDVNLHRGRLDLADVIVFFTVEAEELMETFWPLALTLQPAGGFWVAWPKRASKVPTDMTEQRVRDVALPHGLVDNKVCAIDAVWSGLRVVVRKENRKIWPPDPE